MSEKADFLKSTIVGGVLFIMPLAMLLIIIGKLVPIVKMIDSTLMGVFPDDSILSDVAMHLVALVIVLLLCFFVGLFAQSPAGRRLMSSLEDMILGAIPSFHFFKGFTASMQESDEIAANFTPIVVKFDDYSQMAFEIERIPSINKVAVYLPGAPNSWSGTVVYVDPQLIEHLDLAVPEVVRIIKKLGKGTSDSLERAAEK